MDKTFDGRPTMNGQPEEPEQCVYWPFSDNSETDDIAAMAAAAVMSDYRDNILDLPPAEAVAAIRRFDLTNFDWCPKGEEEFRSFLGRYVPMSVLQSIVQFEPAEHASFMRAWEPGSDWCPIFMRMVALARHGAFRAYQAILAEEAGEVGKEEHTGSKTNCVEVPAEDAPRHKGVKTIQ